MQRESVQKLCADNVAEYLRQRGAASQGEVLAKNLSSGMANAVLMIMDMGAGEAIGTDMRSESQKKRGVPDQRMRQGNCFVLKQPREHFGTTASWRVDLDRVWIERDALTALEHILPTGTLPRVLWSDEENHVLAISAATTGALNFKSELLAGRIDPRATKEAAVLLATLHTSSQSLPALRERFADPRLFDQQRTDPYLRHLLTKHTMVSSRLQRIMYLLMTHPLCLIHGDYSPSNILLMPQTDSPPTAPALMLLDFEVSFRGNPVFDVATFLNHLLLKAFRSEKKWRPFMIAADRFWNQYISQTPKAIHGPTMEYGGSVLGALLLAGLDGKSPVEYLPEPDKREQVGALAISLLTEANTSMDNGLDMAGVALDKAAEN